MSRFPRAIEDFASNFVSLQEKRQAADYDPALRLTKSEVASDIIAARDAIAAFAVEPVKDRRAFAVHVLFKRRAL